MKDNSDWQNQVHNKISTSSELERYIHLTDEQKQGISAAEAEFSWWITPYYAGLMDKDDGNCPIRLQAVPDSRELLDPQGMMDPLEEEKNSPAPNVIKVYPDRVAWCVSNVCPVLCRHCLRKRMVGREHFDFSKEAREAAFRYFERTPEIRDVLITGGDPLMCPDDLVEELLARLRSIPHIEIIRIGSRTPCTMPQRITPRLCAMLKKYHPFWLNTQFNHPKELTEEAREACALLADAGIPLGNQSVLMRGINDNTETMKKLVQGLVKFRVRPYYIYQAQLLAGTAHFRTPVETGIEILRGLRGYTTGFSVPTYVLDTPYGKIPMAPNYMVDRDDEAVYLKSYDGQVWREPNPREADPHKSDPPDPGPHETEQGNEGSR
jgi:lysine 2,3-aminomutase